MSIRKLVLCASLLALLTTALQAQGSQAPIGGGCPNRVPPTISGTLAIGSNLSIDDPGCFTGQSGGGFMFFGSRLPQSQWVTLPLAASILGTQPCDVVLLPLASLGVSSLRPTTIPIPNNPALRGGQVSLQAFCVECGFAGCFDVLTQGVEVTIG